MMGKRYTTRLNLQGKCGSCVHAHYTSRKYPCAIKCDAMNPQNSLFQRSRAACVIYKFDSTKICECGETKEDWYNFCPTCGVFIGERRTDGEKSDH